MTVSELRKALEGVPDDLEVKFSLEGWDHPVYDADIYEHTALYWPHERSQTFMMRPLSEVPFNEMIS